MEMCFMTSGQRYPYKLNEDQACVAMSHHFLGFLLTSLLDLKDDKIRRD